MKYRNWLLVAASVMVFSAFADKLELKSGTVLTGKTLGVKDGVIKFQSDDFGVLDVKPDSVKQIEDAAKKPMPVAQLKVIPKEPETWHGSVNVAYNATRGNTYENSASIIANVNHRWEKDRLNADFGYHYGETGKADGDNQKTTDRWEAEVKHDHFWLEKVYHYEDLRYDRDMIQALLNRYRVGVGGGYQWLDGYVHEATGKWSFNQEAGINWVKEEYEDSDEDKKDGFAALRYGHHLKYLPKWQEGVEVFHNLEALPDVDNWDKYLVKADIGFSAKVIKNFDLLVKMEWDFDSLPANDRKKSDTRYIVGLGYKW